MSKNDRELITGAAFLALARKRIRVTDLDGYEVLKAGRMVKQSPAQQEDRNVPFILSNADVDREGDSILVSGWDTRDFEKNPVVLWAHDHGAPPIASSSAPSVVGLNLTATASFAPADISSFADQIFKMYRARPPLLSAVSVGFQPIEWDMSDSGVNFRSQALLEYSGCPVPAHPGALMLVSLKAKGIDTSALASWCAKALDTFDRRGDAADRLRQEINLFRISADPKGSKSVPVRRPTKDAASDEDTYASMMTLLTEVGTAASVVKSSIQALRSTPTLVAGDDDAAAERQANLDAIAANATAGSAVLSTIASLAVGLGAKPSTKAAKRSRAKDVLVLDDEFDLESLDISEKDVEEAIAAAVRGSLMQITGRVD